MAESYRYDIAVLSNWKEIPFSRGKVDPEELRLIEEFVGALRRRYRDKRVYCYPKDALPGRDIFDELFESIDGSRWIVVLFTTGSQESRPWLDYSNKMSLIQAGLGRKGRFKDYIPVNLNVWDLPRMIDNKTVIDFRERAAAAWDKLDGVFNGGDRDSYLDEILEKPQTESDLMTDSFLSTISRKLLKDDGYDLGLQMGLTYEEVESIADNYQRSSSRFIFHVLRKCWKRTSDDREFVKILHRTLRELRRVDIAEEMCEKFNITLEGNSTKSSTEHTT